MTATTPTPMDAAAKRGVRFSGSPIATIEGNAGWGSGPGVAGAVTDGHLRARPLA